MARKRKQRISIRGLDNFALKKQFLIEQAQNFDTGKTTYTAKITRIRNGEEKVELYYDSIMSKRNFILARQLKSQIGKNIDKIPHFDFDRVKYCVYNYPKLIPRTVIRNVYEVDLNSAYMQACYNLGLIDAKLFARMSKVDKITRLKCLGSIATRNVINVFVNGRMENLYVKEDAQLRKSWFYIVRTIDNILLKFAEMYDEFLFYYVDGIYVVGEKVAIEIANALTALGYPNKTKRNLNIKVGTLGDLLVRGDGEERIFNVRRDEFKKWVSV